MRKVLCLHTLRADCNRNRPERQPSSNPLPPHAPCRLQPLAASAYSIHSQLCLHTLRADCNLFVRHGVVFRLILCLHTLRADCNKARAQRWNRFVLCLHTLRADCNRRAIQNFHQGRKLCLHTLRADCNETLTMARMKHRALCLHTLRADCNDLHEQWGQHCKPLPPHAPCRLQQHPSCGIRLVETALPPHAPCRLQRGLNGRMVETENFASTRSVQIATPRTERGNVWAFSLPPHAPCRLQRQKCTELQYALFRTCVESVDSFSVLNKAMLR